MFLRKAKSRSRHLVQISCSLMSDALQIRHLGVSGVGSDAVQLLHIGAPESRSESIGRPQSAHGSGSVASRIASAAWRIPRRKPVKAGVFRSMESVPISVEYRVKRARAFPVGLSLLQESLPPIDSLEGGERCGPSDIDRRDFALDEIELFEQSRLILPDRFLPCAVGRRLA